MKPLSHVTDPRMVAALAHPLRVQILDRLENRAASPSELAEQIGAPLGNVSYHVRRLESLGVLKLERKVRRRGAVEHYYRVENRPSIRGEAWKGTPDIVKEAFLNSVLGNIARQVNAAASSGGFGNDSHVSRLPLMLDEEGFKEVADEYERLVGRLREIETDARKRAERADHQDEVGTLAVLMFFEAAPGDEADGDSPTDGASDGAATRRANRSGSKA
jgi:DNA-binding transcriptional ArsR family regulator